MTPERAWWKEAIVYQIYPQSFNDTDGDGVGDIEGIIEQLDYLDALDIDVVWLNPVYESPHHDDGYDVSDYRAIREEYGTMEQWEELLDGLHDRDIRLIMDLVVNHTSDEHEWFVAAREQDPEFEDYYVWKDGHAAEDATDSPGPADRTPPNNWESAFGGSAWQWDDEVGQYYLHLFDEHQPDLDWENTDVRDDVYEMMNWWLDKGIDGFRLDVINLISKPQEYPDGSPHTDWVGIEHFSRGPRLVEFLDEMNDETFAGRDTMTVGEMAALQLADAGDYVGADGPLDMVFHFDHVTLDYDDEDGWWTVVDWDLTDLKQVVTNWQTGLDDGWNAVYLGNHDQPRIVSRFGDDGAYREESAKLLATYLLTLRGTPFLFQGDEIGMTNYPWETLAEQEDAQTVGRVKAAIEAGDIEGFDEVKELVRYRSRDNSRTPMQWDASEHAGFTTGDPWLPVNPNHESVNVAAERDREDGILAYYRELIDLRHETDALVYGEYELLLPEDEQVFAYTRTLDDDEFLVALNFSDAAATVDLPLDDARLVVGNYDDEPTGEPTTLRPYEARVYRR
ncbi:glycoside hydrolase family 13 protein [Halorarius litoreus]|uniref:glycoside hydrolase family 13 protein n=1 Tax=Halorarius litoreus TaxID=2962676 RepID=UPI0020CEF0D7|nr:alpha-glucosidase [Halorarius litoreus]